MSYEPDIDELTVRDRLVELIDGPAAAPPAVPPMPTERPRDWLDDILDIAPAPTEPRPVEEPAAKTKPVPEAPAKQKPRLRRPARTGERHDPRESLLEATARIPRRIRWLTYHASAAGAGWWLGWTGWATDTAAWYAAGHWVSPSAFVLYGFGGLLIALYRRSRAWAWPAAWAAAAPVSSIALGVLLYGTGY